MHVSYKKIRNSFLLVLTALVWGIAFVSQSTGGDAVGPFSFNCIRSFIGSLVLIPVIFLLDRLNLTQRIPKSASEKKTLWLGGISCGVVLFFASTFQQLGITMGTSSGKAGFLTACYILLVPIFGIFLGKKCGLKIWCCVGITVIGLYLLCMRSSLAFELNDGMVLISALLFALHILIIDHFSPKTDGVRMSCIQFLVCGILGLFPMIFREMPGNAGSISAGIQTWGAPFATLDAWIPILYAGIMSCGVGYTLQIIGQEGLNPTIASLLMSLESVFSVIAGALILQERMSARELFGCGLIFVGIILAQIPSLHKKMPG